RMIDHITPRYRLVRLLTNRLAERFPRLQCEMGQVLIISALVLPVMLGFVGLALDVGLLFAHRTERQRAADAASIAGAQYLMYNPNDTTGARNEACSYARKNGYGAANCPVGDNEVRINIPPASGPNSSNLGAVEVIITKTDSTTFMRILGKNDATVQGRGVATSKPRKANYALVILDPTLCDSFTTSSNITINGGGAIVDSNATTGSTCIGESAKQNGGSIITAKTCFDKRNQPIVCSVDYPPSATRRVPNNSSSPTLGWYSLSKQVCAVMMLPPFCFADSPMQVLPV